jgi:ribosomal protein S18 acetylase RimI-like enzyme
MIRSLAHDQIEAAAAVLVDAFADYPVMAYLIGATGSPARARLTALFEYFVAARVLRDGLVLATGSEPSIDAVALVTTPLEGAAPPELAARREALWRQLGDDALVRYQGCGEVWRRFALAQPHYHLNLIGVRRSAAGRGLGRRLLDEIHARSAADPRSAGVTLTTEDPANVSLYLRFGYQVVGESLLAPGIRTWSFFRPDRSAAG